MIEDLLHANASACVLEHEALLLRKNEGMRAQCLNNADDGGGDEGDDNVINQGDDDGDGDDDDNAMR